MLWTSEGYTGVLSDGNPDGNFVRFPVESSDGATIFLIGSTVIGVADS